MIDGARTSTRISAAVLIFTAPAALLAATNVPLANSGFESPYSAVSANNGLVAGWVANGWSDNSTWSDSTVQYSQDFSNPHSGASCQKMVVAAVADGEAQLLQSVPLLAGSLYTASVWMRGLPGTQAVLRVQQAASPNASYLDNYVYLTADWQQVSMQGYIVSNVSANFIIALTNPGTVWIDDARLSYVAGVASPTPNPGPISPSFFGMHVAHFLDSRFTNPGFEPPFVSTGTDNPISGNIALGWYDNSSWANVTVVYSEDTNNPHGGVSAQEVDVKAVESGAVQLVEGFSVVPGATYTFSAWLRGQAGMTVNLVLQNQNSPYNYYAITPCTLAASWAQCTAGGQINDTGEVLLMVQATASETFSVDDAAFTGANGQPVSGGVPWPAARFGTLRLWDSGTTWTALEPLKGVWNWEPLDTWVAAAAANGNPDILLTLGQTPAWASSNPSDVNYVGAGAPAPPIHIQDWEDYITAVAQRYQGRIRYYEIWNEPNDSTYFTGTVTQLAQLTQTAYQILKSVDPGNTVISPAAYSTGYLANLLAAGIGPYVDAIGFHVYTTPPELTGPQLADVRLAMQQFGVASLPLWDTEGASGDTTTSTDEAAAYIVRKYLTDLAYGAVRYDWYTWGAASSFCVGTEQSDPRQLTPAAQAYRIMYDWLLGASLTQAAIDSFGTWQIWLTLATGDQGIIVWNPMQNVQFPIPTVIEARSARDIFGGVTAIPGTTVGVTDSPLLVSSCCQAAPVAGAVANSASFADAVSPGSLASIFYGAALAPQPIEAGALPLPAALGGVSVTIDGFYSPMLYVDSGQINFQVPFEAQTGSATMMVRSPSGMSTEYPLTISPAVPGVFQNGQNLAVATDAQGNLITVEHPALAGSVIVVYLTGIGSVTGAPLDGSGAPASPPAQAILTASATVGGMPAPIQFLGLTPYYVGLAQANIQVPQLKNGTYPLVITVAGVGSMPVQLAVVP